MALNLKKKNGKLGQKTKMGNTRNRFKKRKQTVLDKAYKERDKKSKSKIRGKSIFNTELMKQFDIKEFEVTMGDHYFEILPTSWNEEVTYFIELSTHGMTGISNDTFICKQRWNGQRCYRCEQQRSMWDDDQYTKDDCIKLYPWDRAVHLIWERTNELLKNEEPDYTFYLWDFPKVKVHKPIQDKTRDKLKQINIDISDLSQDGEGKTIQISVEKQGDFPAYSVDTIEREKPIPSEVLDKLAEILDYAEEQGYEQALEMFLHIPEYEEVKASADTENLKVSNNNKDEDKDKKKLNIKKDKDPEEDLMEQLDEIKEELITIAKSPLKWRKWCKENDYEEALDIEDKEEAIEAIIDDMHEKAIVNLN